jgi:hypothetical protein
MVTSHLVGVLVGVLGGGGEIGFPSIEIGFSFSSYLHLPAIIITDAITSTNCNTLRIF